MRIKAMQYWAIERILGRKTVFCFAREKGTLLRSHCEAGEGVHKGAIMYVRWRRQHYSADDRSGERGVGFAAGGTDRHGNQRQPGRQGGHQDRAEPDPGGFLDRLPHRLPVAHAPVRKIQKDEAVFHNDAGDHDDAHERRDRRSSLQS